MKYSEPSAYELAQYRDRFGLGMVESKKQIMRDKVIADLKKGAVAPNDLQDILLLILEGKV